MDLTSLSCGLRGMAGSGPAQVLSVIFQIAESSIKCDFQIAAFFKDVAIFGISKLC